MRGHNKVLMFMSFQLHEFSYPFLSEFLSNVERLDGVKEYLDSRPELIGVGSEPQLVIDGVARSTGIANE